MTFELYACDEVSRPRTLGLLSDILQPPIISIMS